ncbi:MAG: alcohol dehydrogenase catalytic domain-containing protein, partial [Acidimicrobiaceae bacterium]|nr:alcohol dehydrogenase catalytic domain-containing protein [Acidimicrobiaceae bacterium]
MRAAVYRGERTVVVEDVAVPSPEAGQVLVQISHCGICGTDLHLMMEDWGWPGFTGGHEYSGVVVSVGEDVTGWSVGDRVVGGPRPGCGNCPPCLSGSSNLCTARAGPGRAPAARGAFAEYKVLDGDALYGIPDDMDLRTAALTEPVAVALRGVRRSGIGPRSRALVTGAGPIGLFTVAVLASIGVTAVTVSEPSPLRRELAQKIGASTVVSPDELQQLTSAVDLVAEPFQAAFECSGRAEAVEAALAHLDKAGTLILSGTGMVRPGLDVNRVILHELSIAGTVEYTPDDFRAALELLASHRLPTDLLIEPDDLNLDGLRAGMQRLMAGELAGKVMVVP